MKEEEIHHKEHKGLHKEHKKRKKNFYKNSLTNLKTQDKECSLS